MTIQSAASESIVGAAKASDSPCLLQAIGLCKSYISGGRWKRKPPIIALDNVDIALPKGKTVAVVGRSGAGKSTLAMCLALLETPDAGDIIFEGSRIGILDRNSLGAVRRRIQIIFQSSVSAFSPRLTVAQIVEEPLKIQKCESSDQRSQIVSRLLEQVGMGRSFYGRRPDELSGGQRQRVAIARSLALNPSLLILDEPFVGLDAPIRNQIVNLLLELQEAKNLSYLYISHDLDLVGCFADTTLMMDRGKLIASEDLRACSN